MIDTLHISLGVAPARGGDAARECLFFKALMRNIIGRDPDGAWLHMIGVGHDGMEMLVEYDQNVLGALEWAKKAQEHAEQVWEQVAGRQQPAHEHIISRKPV